MKLLKSLLLIISLAGSILLNSCNSNTKETKVDSLSHVPNIDSTQTQDISIITLISNPKDYAGRKVRVIGYLNLEFENNAVYLNKEDYALNISKNGIWLELTRDDIHNRLYENNNNEYVVIEGTFNIKQGHEGSFSGSLTNVTRLEKWGK